MSLSKSPASFRRLLMLCFVLIALFMIAIVVIYFSLMNYSADDQVEQSFESMKSGMDYRLNQIISNFDISAKKAAYSTDGQAVLFTSNPFEYLSASSAATEMVNFVMESNPNIAGIYMVSGKNRLLYTDNGHNDLFQKVLNDYHFDRDAITSNPVFTHVYYEGEQSVSTPYFLYLMPVYDTRNGEFSKNAGAVCAVLCDVHTLAQDMDMDSSGKAVVAVQYEGDVISSSRPITQAERATFKNLKNGQQTVTLGKKKCLAASVKMQASGWEFSYVMVDNAALTATKKIWHISFFALAIAIVIMMLGMIRITLMITKPARNIVDEMRDVRNGRQKRIGIPKLVEFREMAESINYTLECIERANIKEKDTQVRLFESIIAQKNAELFAWRSQINPHFFFNTLECMRSMARHSGIKDLEEVISSLSKIFRYSLDAGNMVTLKDELKNANNYFNIMSHRFPGQYEIRNSVEQEALGNAMPAMILQPIVENCIQHGLKVSKKNPRIIFIQGHMVQKEGRRHLLIRISDNGVGIPEDRLSEIQGTLNAPYTREDLIGETAKGKNIGLQNINHRLKILYGEENTLRIRTKAGYFTSIEINILDSEPQMISSQLVS